MRILVADDSENARDILRVTLQSGGFTDVTFSTSGQEALDALRDAEGRGQTFDIVLLDIVMPDIDGIQACTQIRAMPRHASVPILMITSLSDMDTLAQAFAGGANDYVTKPFQRAELLARVRNAFRFKGELDRRGAREAELLELTRRLNRGPNSLESFVDPTTATLSRETFEAALRRLPRGTSFIPAVMALQVENMAAYGERYGAGGLTTLLATLADALKRAPGHLGDLLSYFGDGLFVALLHLESPVAASAAAETMRQRIAALPLQEDKPCAFSIGMAALRADEGREPKTLLSDAVSAVERAMAEGGNRVAFAEGRLPLL